mmetsp:Transcript_5958/g.9404  ORF Transcript_5958/g.9404 Transcript_5958/m.9404 type:complete len:85 (+) Transcript_5958:3982-4236(+)
MELMPGENGIYSYGQILCEIEIQVVGHVLEKLVTFFGGSGKNMIPKVLLSSLRKYLYGKETSIHIYQIIQLAKCFNISQLESMP